MINRRLAVFSGIETAVVDRIAPGLRSMATDVAFVKLGSDGLSKAYFDRLSARALAVASNVLTGADVRLYALLVSCAQSSGEQELEVEHFFPALRRLDIPREYRRDRNKAGDLIKKIQDTFSSSMYQDVARKVTPQGDDRLLLPIMNTKLDRMTRHYLDLYRLKETGLTRRLDRDISRMKKGRGYRIRGVDFKGTVNDGTHPIRRCTDTPACDLRALMRFGATVPERFEFDVSCSTGLEGKSFYLCDGSAARINKGVSHLNMRINDDFMIG